MRKLKAIKGVTISEQEIKNQILAWLWYNRIDAWPNDSVGIYDAKNGCYRRKSKFFVKGRPDIEGWAGPDCRWFGIEVKTPKGVLSDSQKDFIMRAEERGAIIFVARSLDDVIRRQDLLINGY